MKNYEVPEISVVSLVSDEAMMGDTIPGGNTDIEYGSQIIDG